MTTQTLEEAIQGVMDARGGTWRDGALERMAAEYREYLRLRRSIDFGPPLNREFVADLLSRNREPT